jgi:hypothetical protein
VAAPVWRTRPDRCLASRLTAAPLCPLPSSPPSPVWDRPDEFEPERFPLDGPVPSEQNTDYRYIPFRCGLNPGGGGGGGA